MFLLKSPYYRKIKCITNPVLYLFVFRLTTDLPSLECRWWRTKWRIVPLVRWGIHRRTAPQWWPAPVYCKRKEDCLSKGINPQKVSAKIRQSSVELSIRGLQFYTLFGISIGIKRRLIDIGKKITFYFLQNVWNVQFFRICILRLQKVLLWPNNFFLKKNINVGIKKTQNFLLISNSLMPAFRNAHNQKVKILSSQKRGGSKGLPIDT